MAVFFVIRGHDRGNRLETNADVVRLGRDSTNDIQLHDSEVSRFHAEVRKTDTGFELVDLESSNGSYVNSNPVSQKRIRTGDRLQFGRTTIVFTAEVDLTTRDISAAEVDLIASSPAESQIIQRVRHDESQVVFSDDISVVGNVAGKI
ncbi:MAG: FHA domain-containing protein [Pirellulaceae bacterium]